MKIKAGQAGITPTVTDWVKEKEAECAMEVALALALLLPTPHVIGTPSFGTSHLMTDLVMLPGLGSAASRLLAVTLS